MRNSELQAQQIQSHVKYLESIGYATFNDAKWSAEDRRALEISWQRFSSLPTHGDVPLNQARFQVIKRGGLYVFIEWAKLDPGSEKLIVYPPGAGIYGLSISNDFERVEQLIIP